MIEIIVTVFVYVLIFVALVVYNLVSTIMGVAPIWNDMNFFMQFLIFCIFFGIIDFMISLCFIFYANKKMQQSLPLLDGTEANAKLFIKKMDDILFVVNNRNIKASCHINCSAAYSLLEDYQGALEEFTKTKPSKLKGNLKNNYWVSYVGLLYEAGEYKTALAVEAEHGQEIAQMKNFPQMLPHLELINLYHKLACGQTEGLWEDTKVLREKYKDNTPHFHADLSKFEKRLEESEE